DRSRPRHGAGPDAPDERCQPTGSQTKPAPCSRLREAHEARPTRRLDGCQRSGDPSPWAQDDSSEVTAPTAGSGLILRSGAMRVIAACIAVLAFLTLMTT